MCCCNNVSVTSLWVNLQKSHSALNGDWSTKQVRDSLGRVSDFYAAKVVESGNVKLLENPSELNSDEEKQREAMQEEEESVLIL